MPEINYKELLKKYMNLIGEQEGTYFLSSVNDDFTKEEREELKKLIKEI